ncbi:MAG: hypothetical protein NTZ05_23170 [Chloroflexi bacterium]|nr:hypothetical protein [Chloroflexota bacterium]
MGITQWTMRCLNCGEQLVATQPDAEFKCGRCGTVRPGVTASRARWLEQVSGGDAGTAGAGASDAEQGGMMRSLGRMFSRLVR